MLRRRVLLREWEDREWRVTAGWVGSDLIHRPGGRGVQVLAYGSRRLTLTLILTLTLTLALALALALA